MRRSLIIVVVALATSLMWAASALGGPVILAGIDGEDGGPGGHGPIATWDAVVQTHYNNATNGQTGILVIGGGKDPFDSVTTYWNQIATDTGLSVTFVNGAANIASAVFVGPTGPRLLVISSDDSNTGGGLTTAENDALTARSSDVATFVNNGGALLGFTSDFAVPYAYMTGGLGSITAVTGQSYDDIDPTPDGTAAGVDNTLDVFAWHDYYTAWPSYLVPLAYVAGSTTNVAALGGLAVIIGPPGDKMMTGGGRLKSQSASHGFTLHCNTATTGPNNLQANWGKGKRFHLEEMTAADCTDDAAFSEGKPVAGFDTHTGSGTGRYNGVSGYNASWVITDHGEPGRADTFQLTIKDPTNTTTVASVSGALDGGNHQAHNG